jgi:glycosyltransferase involved in cell wall biosynthesis
MFKEIIIIPAYNEYKTLNKILKKISNKYKVIVINDASTDRTDALLNAKKIENIKNKKNKGYEKSLILGFKYVIKYYPNIENIITFDADGEHNTFDLTKIIRFFNKKKPDLLICNRINIKRLSEKKIYHKFKKKFQLKDPLSGLKVYKVSVLKNFIEKLKFKYFLVDLVKLYCNSNCKVINYPIKCNIIRNRKARIGNIAKANNKILNIQKII